MSAGEPLSVESRVRSIGDLVRATMAECEALLEAADLAPATKQCIAVLHGRLVTWPPRVCADCGSGIPAGMVRCVACIRRARERAEP